MCVLSKKAMRDIYWISQRYVKSIQERILNHYLNFGWSCSNTPRKLILRQYVHFSSMRDRIRRVARDKEYIYLENEREKLWENYIPTTRERLNCISLFCYVRFFPFFFVYTNIFIAQFHKLFANLVALLTTTSFLLLLVEPFLVVRLTSARVPDYAAVIRVAFMSESIKSNYPSHKPMSAFFRGPMGKLWHFTIDFCGMVKGNL